MAIAGVVFVLVVVPGIASAHAVGTSQFNAPLPLSLLFGGAGATVALTALWLAVTGKRDDAADRSQRVFTVSSQMVTPARYAVGGLFLAVVLAALSFGAVGRQVPAENLATVFT